MGAAKVRLQLQNALGAIGAGLPSSFAYLYLRLTLALLQIELPKEGVPLKEATLFGSSSVLCKPRQGFAR